MSDDPRTEARDYLADVVYGERSSFSEWEDAEEGTFGDGSEWGERLEEWLRALPPTDPLCELLRIVLAPFCEEDDQRLQGLLYFAGDTSDYLDYILTGGDYRQYMTGLVGALALDHARWITHLKEAGDVAQWGDVPPVLLSERDES